MKTPRRYSKLGFRLSLSLSLSCPHTLHSSLHFLQMQWGKHKVLLSSVFCLPTQERVLVYGSVVFFSLAYCVLDLPYREWIHWRLLVLPLLCCKEGISMEKELFMAVWQVLVEEIYSVVVKSCGNFRFGQFEFFSHPFSLHPVFIPAGKQSG